MFGFQKNKTLVSYVPRKNKAVILLSTMHHDSKIDVETRKPEIIMDYNCSKGGVDTVDKMCAAYSVSRIIQRWPLVIFYSLMNIAGINAQVLFSYSKHNNAPKMRRLFLKTLAFDEGTSCFSSSNLKFTIGHIIFFENEICCSKYIRCIYNPPFKTRNLLRMWEKKNAATSMKCTKCMRFVCKLHSKKIIICEKCSNNDDNDNSE